MEQRWRQRRRRIRTWLKPLPRRATIHRYPILKRFAAFARRRPYLWSFKDAPVVRAIYLGSLLAYLPTYGAQIVIAFIAAWFGRANLTLMIGLQMITNPLTAGPIYLAAYGLGSGMARLLQLPPRHPVLDGALALILGGLVLGLLTALLLHGLWVLGRYEARRFRHRRQSRLRQENAGN
ncbi:DUF2062 domain-containing protein [Arenimonas sp. GDDSR-1]|uniref:DUF2062 domain-containing protein n=1 Tax=Arenimonas sp. GDDSR-1 TaxID=2950125 RepID=UPI002620758B|nr:DUF2062 domain-containing protein [Arenimonas sp. GDDSR-1]